MNTHTHACKHTTHPVAKWPRQYLSFRHANTHMSTHTHTHALANTHTHTHTHTHTVVARQLDIALTSTATMSSRVCMSERPGTILCIKPPIPIRAEFTITAITTITCSTSCGPDKHSQYVWETVSVPFQSRVYNHHNHHYHLQHILWTRQAQSICLRNSLRSFSEQSLQSPQSPLSPAAHPVDQTSTVDTSEKQSPFLFRAEFSHCNHHYHLQHILRTRQPQSIRLRNSLRSFSEQSLQSLQSPLSPAAHPADQTTTVDKSERQSPFLFRAEFTVTKITAVTCSTIWGTHKHSDYVWETVSHPFQSGDYYHSYHCSHLQPTLWNRQVWWICPTVSCPFQSGDYNHSYHCSHLQPTLWKRQVQWICLTVSCPFQSWVYDHRNHRRHLQHILWNRKAWWMCLRDSLPSFSEQSLQPLAAHPLKQTTVNMSESLPSFTEQSLQSPCFWVTHKTHGDFLWDRQELWHLIKTHYGDYFWGMRKILSPVGQTRTAVTNQVS